MKPPPDVTLRRALEQVQHCLEEGTSVLAANEDPLNAQLDFEQARCLLSEIVLPTLAKRIAKVGTNIPMSPFSLAPLQDLIVKKP